MIEKDYHYKICTRCFTYNHAPYIEDAMSGFVMQETSFPVVTVIVDDASTDGEQDVIRNYLKEHFQDPYRAIETEYAQIICSKHKKNNNCDFVVLLLKYNHHSVKKHKMPYLKEWMENSKYQALCEGDDYWIDPQKLQKQGDYLDNHPEIGLVHARAKIFNQEQRAFHGICGEQNGGFEEMLLYNPVVTLTTCYRMSLYLTYEKEYSSWNVSGWKMGDYPMWLWMSKQAGVHFMGDVVAVYREQNNSATHSGGLENKLAFIDSTVDIRLFFCNLYKLSNQTRLKIIYNANLSKAANCLARQEKKRAVAYLKKLTIIDRWNLLLRFWFHNVRQILKNRND